MQFFTWGVNKPNIKEKRAAITEDHWKFWDNYDDCMIARGPVLDFVDSSIALGSIHIVELDSLHDAQPIMNDEPYGKAGLFEELIVTRFSSGLNRTQFDVDGSQDSLCFFIYCPALVDAREAQAKLVGEHEAYCQLHDFIFICRGDLLTKEGDWNGSVFFVELPSKEDARSFFKMNLMRKLGYIPGPISIVGDGVASLNSGNKIRCR